MNHWPFNFTVACWTFNDPICWILLHQIVSSTIMLYHLNLGKMNHFLFQYLDNNVIY